MIASVLLALLVGTGFAVLLTQIGTFRHSGRAVMRAQSNAAIAGQLEQLVIDLETGVRGFALTGDERLLQPWTDARAAIPGTARRLAAMVEAPDQARRLRRLRRDIDSYINDYSVPLVATVRRDRAGARSAAATGEGRRRIEALRAQFSRFLDVERARLATRQRRDDRDAAQATTIAAVALGASVVLILLFGVYVARAMAVPVRRAAAMAGRLAGGDLGARLPETGAGEVGMLQRAFNRMGASLEAGHEQLRRLADEQAALRRVATLAAQGMPTGELFAAVTREVGLQCDADLARAERFEADGTVRGVASWSRGGERGLAVGTRLTLDGPSIAAQVSSTGRPARVDSFAGASGSIADEALALGIRSSVGCPIVVGGRTWGVIAASRRRDAPFAPDTESRIAEFTELVATAISNAEARAALDASRARLVTVADDVRRRIVRDLHDGAQQRLIQTIVTLKLANRAEDDHEEMRTLAGEALTQAEQANTELRELAHGILPAALTRGGLAAGVDALVSRVRLPVRVDVPVDRFPPEIEASAYFVVAEALTNVVKHSGAGSADVTVHVDDHLLHVEVRDDGVGGARREGSGLVGLDDRLAALGGRLRIDSPPGGGTRIAAMLPLPS
jgi:signal transduction histidine kinase